MGTDSKGNHTIKRQQGTSDEHRPDPLRYPGSQLCDPFIHLIRQLLIPLMGGSINWPLIFQGLLFYVPFTVILAWLTGLYPGLGLASVQEMQKVLYVVTLSSIFLGILLFFQKLGPSYSRLIFVMTWFLSVAMILGARFSLRKNCSRLNWWGTPLIVFGSPENAMPVVGMLLRNRRLGLKPVYVYDPEGNDAETIKGIPFIKDKDNLLKIAGEEAINYIVFTDKLDTDLTSDIYWMRDLFPHMLFILNTPTISTLWSHTIDLHGTLLVGTDYRLLNQTERLIKFTTDKLLTILILLVSWPLFILLALLVRISSKGPVLYNQKRLGLGGKNLEAINSELCTKR